MELIYTAWEFVNKLVIAVNATSLSNLRVFISGHCALCCRLMVSINLWSLCLLMALLRSVHCIQ